MTGEVIAAAFFGDARARTSDSIRAAVAVLLLWEKYTSKDQFSSDAGPEIPFMRKVIRHFCL